MTLNTRHLTLCVTLLLTTLLVACGGGGGGDTTPPTTIPPTPVPPKPHYAFGISKDSNNTLAAFQIGKTSGRLKFISKANLPGSPVVMAAAQTGDAAYVIASDSNLYRYAVDSSGKLGTSEFKTAPTAPTAMTVSSNGQFVYVVDATNKQVSRYVISGGSLGNQQTKAITDPAISGTNQTDILLNPVVNSIYIASRTDHRVIKFAFDASSGALSGETNYTTAGTNPTALTVSPDGTYLFVANQGDPNIAVATLNPQGIPGTFSAAAIGSNADVFKDLEIDPNGKYLYALDDNDQEIFKYSIANGTLSGPSILATSATLINSISIDPAGKFLYATLDDDDTVLQYAINQTDGTLTAITPTAVATFTAPVDLQTTKGSADEVSRGTYAYVVNDVPSIAQYSVESNGSLTALSPSSVPTDIFAFNLAADPDGQNLYVANLASTTVSQHAIATDGTLGTFSSSPVGRTQWDVVVDPRGQFAYASNTTNAVILQYTIDATTGALAVNTAEAEHTVGSGPQKMAIDTTGQFLYVVQSGLDNIGVYDINANGTLANKNSFTTGIGSPGVLDLVVGPKGLYLYAVNNTVDSIIKIPIKDANAGNNLTMTTYSLPAGFNPTAVTIDPSGQYLYAAGDGSGQVASLQINQANGDLSAHSIIATGADPIAIKVGPTGNYAYVATDTDNKVYVHQIDKNNNGVLMSSILNYPGPTNSALTAIEFVGPWQ